MRAIIIALLLAGTPQAQQICDLAPQWRQRNRSGSCGHASTTSGLRWLQEFSKADRWWGTYRNGENFGRHLSRLRSQGIRFVATRDGDERILEYATWSRRGAVVYWPPWHIVNFMGTTVRNGQKMAVILDNNRVGRLEYHPYQNWLRAWRRTSGAAFVILDGSAPPPVPGGQS